MAFYVELTNLEKNKELNGTLAEVLDYDEGKERFVVKLCNMSKAKVSQYVLRIQYLENPKKKVGSYYLM